MNSTKQIMATTNDTQVQKDSSATAGEPHLLFGNTNYLLVLLGIVFIAIGFALMAGGGSSDPTVFDAEAVYSFRRITLAPIVVLTGFLIEIVAILKKT
jgi:hypothetical protein